MSGDNKIALYKLQHAVFRYSGFLHLCETQFWPFPSRMQSQLKASDPHTIEIVILYVPTLINQQQLTLKTKDILRVLKLKASAEFKPSREPAYFS